jgi:hypothetical protein
MCATPTLFDVIFRPFSHVECGQQDRFLWCVLFVAFLASATVAAADPPAVGYIFPAGGQRGTRVVTRIGGCNLYESPRLIWNGHGIAAPPTLTPAETIWFEGPLIPQPASQAREDYPRDYTAALDIAPDAPLGRQTWRLATSQGVTAAWGFVVGDLPEIVEREVDGPTPPTPITLPLTINGRIFPREEVDEWQFTATKGETVSCHVATAAFGSPLRAAIAVLDDTGRVLDEALPERDNTPTLRFTVPADGTYRVRIHDVRFGGLQDHVYRLTVTAGTFVDAIYPLGGRRGSTASFELLGANLRAVSVGLTLPTEDNTHLLLQGLPPERGLFSDVQLDVDDLEELYDGNAASPVLPCVLNGRITMPGEQDQWTFAATKDVVYDFEVRAARLGSPLDAVLRLSDLSGKLLAEVDDTANLNTDARLRWTAPADGEYVLAIRDRLSDRGGPHYGYRIRATTVAPTDFALSVKGDTAIVERGKELAIKVALERAPGFKGPVELRVDGLPAGVDLATPAIIPANKNDGQFTLKVAADAPVNVVPLTVLGVANVGEQEVVRRGVIAAKPAAPDDTGLDGGDNRLWLAVAVPTPFKFVGEFETRYIPRGSVFVRKYQLERNGFDGPVTVHLADRQGRHLQGVTAAPVVVPAGANEFEFGVTLPPWMEIGRTCRSTLSATAVTTDADSTRHTIRYSSNDQHNQMIALVDPGRLAVRLPRETLSVRPGETVSFPISIARGPGLTGPVTVVLIAPADAQGVSAASLDIPSAESSGLFAITCAPHLSRIEGQPFTIRATARDERQLPITAETAVSLIRAP